MEGYAVAETRSLHCGALSGLSGQGWRGGVQRPKGEVARGVGSSSRVAEAGGEEAGQSGGLSERRRDQQPQGRRPCADPERPQQESGAGSPQVPGLSPASGAEAAPHTRVPSWRPELRRGRDGEAEAARGEATIPRSSPQHPVTARLRRAAAAAAAPYSQMSYARVGRGALDGTHELPLPHHFSRSSLRKTPSLRFPISFFPTQPPHSCLQPLSEPGADEPLKRERLRPFGSPSHPAPAVPSCARDTQEGAGPLIPCFPPRPSSISPPAPLPTAGSRGEPRGAGRYGGGDEAQERVMEQL